MKRFVVFCLLVACGGGDAQPQAAAPKPAPSELREVVFALGKGTDGVSQRVGTALEGALLHAGYKVADNGDLVLDPRINYAREPSVWQKNVNGREVFDIRVRVTLTIKQKEQLVDQGTTEFVTDSEDPIDENLMAPLVNGIGRSERIRRAAQNVIESRQPATITDETEEKAWIAAKVEACRQPITLDACDKVRLFLADHPSSAHADDAKKALEQAQPGLEKLQKDENDWQRADVDECKSKKACTGVELYLKLHAAGLHAKEARTLLRP
jgi:hypothetical protein